MYQLKNISNVCEGLKLLSVVYFLITPVLAVENNSAKPTSDWLIRLAQKPVDLPSQVNGVDDLIVSVLTNNSQLRSEYAGWQMRESSVRMVVNLPDPTLSAGYFARSVETAQGPQVAKVSVSQVIPWLSKVKAAKADKQALADQAYEKLENTWLTLIRELRYLWIEAVYLQQSLIIMDRKINLSSDLEAILTTQYTSASISHQKYALVQIRTLELADRREVLIDQRQRTLIELGILLELEGSFPKDALPEKMVVTKFVNPNSTISNIHPRLGNLDRLLDGSIAQEAAARADYLPNLKLGLDYIFTGKKELGGIDVPESGQDPIIFSVGMALPIWNWKAKRSAVSAAQHQVSQVKALRQREEQLLQQQHDLSFSKLNENRRLVDLLRNELIPRSEEIVKVSEQAYISQSIDIQAFTETQQKLLDLKLSLAKAQRSTENQNIVLAYLRGE